MACEATACGATANEIDDDDPSDGDGQRRWHCPWRAREPASNSEVLCEGMRRTAWVCDAREVQKKKGIKHKNPNLVSSYDYVLLKRNFHRTCTHAPKLTISYEFIDSIMSLSIPLKKCWLPSWLGSHDYARKLGQVKELTREFNNHG